MTKMGDTQSESSSSHGNEFITKKQKTEVDPNYIFVKFINQKDETTHFKVRRTSKMENAFRSYCQHHELQLGTARFILNGDHIPRTLTPIDLNLKDGVEIEVYSEVNGGNVGPIV